MTEHYMKVCTGCETVITECPCMITDKRVIESICETCARKACEKEESEMIEDIKKECPCGCGIRSKDDWL